MAPGLLVFASLFFTHNSERHASWVRSSCAMRQCPPHKFPSRSVHRWNLGRLPR